MYNRWAVWKTSYYDSDRMMHSLIKITPLMLPPLSFSSALLFFRPFLMTGLRNCPEGSESFLCLCPVGLPQDHGDCLSHLKAFLPQESGPQAALLRLRLHTPQALSEKAEPCPKWAKEEEHSNLSYVFFSSTPDKVQICSLNF